MQCDSCGKESVLIRALIEGVELRVCQACASYGEKLDPLIEKKQEVIPRKEEVIAESIVLKPEVIEMIVNDFASRIKSQRQKKGLTQEALSKSINEKESILRKVEAGKKPSISYARKLENFLDLVLVKEYVDTPKKWGEEKKEVEEATIGNMIKMRVRKKK
ncbi:TIGR00270 family protein [Candidatus Woesearchaeota archaeon]|nr:TIGR00270 family protein [Candidatus Woesearchaeota archaeon]